MSVDSLMDQFASEDKAAGTAALSKSAIIAHSVNPDQHAANITKAKKTGLPAALATPADGPVSVDNLRALMSDFHKLPPVTADHMSNPDNAKLSHDDHPVLSKLEDAFNVFKGAGARIAQGVNSAAASFDETFGMDKGAELLRHGADYWKGVADKAGSTGLSAKVYEGLGQAPQGVAEFVAGVPFAAAKGAAEGYKKDGIKGLVTGALTESVKRYGIGKVFSGIEASGMSGIKKSLTMAVTMGAQTWAEGGDVQSVVASTLTGLALMPPKAGSHGEAIRSELVKKGVDAKVAEDIGTHVDGVAANENAGAIQEVIDTAKESKLKKRDAELFKSFSQKASKETPPVSMPVEKFDEMLAAKGLKPEDVLADPSHYYEARFEGGKVDVPASDLAGIAEHVTPEHVKEMSVDGAPSLADIEAKEAAKVGDTEQGKGSDKEPSTNKGEADKEMIRPAVKQGFDIKTGAEGERHNDIENGAPEEDRGFLAPNGEFLDREQGAKWLQENRPDLYEKLPEDQKAELHSEGLWQSQGIEPKKEVTMYESLLDTLGKQTGVEKGKGNKNWTNSEFQEYLKEGYPSVAGMEKGRVLAALNAEVKGRKLTEGQQQVIDAFNHDNATLQEQYGEVKFYAGIPIMDGVRAAMGIAGDIRDSKTGKMVNKLMTPGLEAAHGIKRGIQSLVLPTAQSPEHLAAGELLGAKLGKMHRNQEATASDLRAESTMFDKMGIRNEKIDLLQNEGVKFMSDMSQGRTMTPKLERVAKKLRAQEADFLKQLEDADAPLESVRENYFPGMWTNDSRKAFNLAVGGMIEAGKGDGKPLAEWGAEDKAAVRVRVKDLMDGGKGSEKDGLQYLTKTPFKGKESFRKGKVFDDIMTAVEFGLEPISTNPIDLWKLKMAEMGRSIMANDALKEWRESGDEKFLPVNKKVPEGWKKVDDKYGTVYGPMDIAGEDTYIGRPLLGHRIVKEPVSDVLNNYLSSSMYNNKYFGTVYKGYMGAANALNQSQLGVGSFFHVGFTESEVIISGGANVLKDMYGVAVGNRTIKQAAKTALEMPQAFIKTPIEGDAILKEWRDPGSSMSPKVRDVAKAAELAGGGFKMEQGLRTGQTEKLVQDWHSDHKVRAALRSPVSAIELMAKPIMDYLVPRQKAGVFGHLATRIIEQNPGKSLEQLTPQFRQAWNRVDSRLGQVRYDRMFMNNSAKSAVQALVRAPGWSGGTIAEIGGSLKDTVSFLKEWADTGRAPAELPDRVAYTVSLMATVTAANALMTYAFTGDKPTGMDFWAFRTGGTDEFGRPERFLLPTYQKDVFAYMQDPGKTLLAKTHPIISIMGDMLKNKDYYGVTIANEDDNQVQKAIERGDYVLKQFVPFWMRGAQKEAERGGGLMETIRDSPQKLLAPQVGIMPATSDYTKSPSEKLMSKYIGQQIPEGGRTQESADTSKARRELVRALRNGATVDSLPDKLQERIATLTERQIKNIEKDASMTPLQSSFSHLQDATLEKSIKVWAKATDEERDQLRDLYNTRVDKYFLDHPDIEGADLDKLNERIQKAEERNK